MASSQLTSTQVGDTERREQGITAICDSRSLFQHKQDHTVSLKRRPSTTDHPDTSCLLRLFRDRYLPIFCTAIIHISWACHLKTVSGLTVDNSRCQTRQQIVYHPPWSMGFESINMPAFVTTMGWLSVRGVGCTCIKTFTVTSHAESRGRLRQLVGRRVKLAAISVVFTLYSSANKEL